MTQEIFKGQDYRLTLLAGIDLTGATVLKILTNNPVGFKGEWTALLTDDNMGVYHDVSWQENNREGVWRFQLYAELAGEKLYGEIVSKTILNNLS